MSNYEIRPVVFKGKVIEKYFVSAKGDFYGPRSGFDKPLTVHYPSDTDTNPYPRVSLGGRGITCHTLMAHTFIPYPTTERPNGFDELSPEWQTHIEECEKRYVMELQVDHIDGDKYNWNKDNLRWVTAKQNQQHYQKEQKKLKYNGL